MNTKTRFAAALTAVALAATLALPSQAEARGRGHGWAIGAGILGAAVIGSAIASSAYAYPPYPVYQAYEEEPVYMAPRQRCFHVDQFDHNGNYFGTRTVCR
jgi:hypothetical protein